MVPGTCGVGAFSPGLSPGYTVPYSLRSHGEGLLSLPQVNSAPWLLPPALILTARKPSCHPGNPLASTTVLLEGSTGPPPSKPGFCVTSPPRTFQKWAGSSWDLQLGEKSSMLSPLLASTVAAGQTVTKASPLVNCH